MWTRKPFKNEQKNNKIKGLNYDTLKLRLKLNENTKIKDFSWKVDNFEEAYHQF